MKVHYPNIGHLCLWSLVFFLATRSALCAESPAFDSAKEQLAQTTLRSIAWVGDQSATEQDYQQLLALKDDRRLIEQFVQSQPGSSWTPSLRNALASGYRYAGRNTLALENWQLAWEQLRDSSNPSAEEEANHALAGEVELLSSLGRVESLRDLLQAAGGRQITDHNDVRRIETARESLAIMVEQPALSFRCGSLALANIARLQGKPASAINALIEEPSTKNGISLSRLVQLNRRYDLGLIAVKRTDGEPVPVPSVVHWSLNHYGALVDYSPEVGYKIVDPTFGKPRWISSSDLDAEASGYFLVPEEKRPATWEPVSDADAASIFGRGYPYNIDDGLDMGCKKPPTTPFATCTTCQGMPTWWVSEPYENLWVADTPVSYTTSRGEQMEFRATFKQRDSMTNDFGYSYPGFLHNWYSKIYIRGNSTANSMPNAFTNWNATLYLGTGGEVDYSSTSTYDEGTQTYLQPSYGTLVDGTQYMVPGFPLGNTTNVPPAGGWYDTYTSGFRVFYPDGSIDSFGFIYWRTNATAGYYEAEALLTDRYDPLGNDTLLTYECYGGCSGDPQNRQYRLASVKDYDGKTTTFSYVSSSSDQLQTITTPYGQTATFTNVSSSAITIIDAMTNSSTINFNTNGYISSLVTPYGTTSFTYYQGPTNDGEGNLGGHNRVDRAVTVVDANGGTNLYVYRFDCSAFLATSTTVPSGTPLGTLDGGTNSATVNYAAVSFRNSFHWDPMQSATLSTINVTSLTNNDYLKAGMKHWLGDSNNVAVVDLVSIEQEPSPDGVNAGQQTFYDYAGKTLNYLQGTNSQIAVTARTQPSGTVQYDWKQYNSSGYVTQDVSTYTSNNTVATRTNTYSYRTNTIVFTESATCPFCSVGETPPYTPIAPAFNSNEVVYLQGAYGQSNNTSSVTFLNLLTGVTNADGSIRKLDNYSTDSSSSTPGNGGVTLSLAHSFKTPLPGAITNELGYITTLSYNADNRLTGVATPAGLHITNHYNSSGFLTNTEAIEIGRSLSYSYANGLVSVWTNELGLVITNTWDNLQRLTGVSDVEGTVSNVYDILDLSATRDKLGNWTYFGYNPLRQLTAITNANGGVTLADYCQCGALTWVRDPATNYTYYYYDLAGRQTNVTYPDGRVLNRVFNSIDQVVQSSDTANTVSNTYNVQGLVTTVKNGGGLIASNIYDVMDRPVSLLDANGVTTLLGYDVLGRVLTNQVSTNTITYGYSTNGLVKVTNAIHGVTSYGNDQAGRVLYATNANLQQVQYQYNPASEMTALIDGLGHSNTWAFNASGWLTNKSDTHGNAMQTNGFDANGRLTTRWMPASGTTTYSYDKAGNVTNIAYPVSSIGFIYDADSRPITMSDAVGTTTFSYTPGGQLMSETGPWSSDTLTNGYSQGYRTSTYLNSPSGAFTFAYGYDAAWRLTNVATVAGAIGYSYEGNSASMLAQSISLPNGASITNQYDPLARLDYTALLNYWGHPLDGYTYAYDARSLRTSITRQLGLTTNIVAPGYDALGQLTSWTAQEASSTARENEQLGYGYDAANNLNTRTNGSMVQTFTTDPLNQLTNVSRNTAFTETGATPAPMTSVTVNGNAATTYGDFTFAYAGITLANGNNTFTTIAENTYGAKATNAITLNLPTPVSLSYDGNGNLTNDGTRVFSYDAENQLTNIAVAGAWQVSFVYDGLNRRRIERDYTWLSGAWSKTNETRFIYDGMQVIQERDTNSNPLVTYTRGLDLSQSRTGAGGIGGLLARTDANGSTFYHADANGNITSLMDGNQNIVARYEYDGFGRAIGQWGTLANANRYRFSSKEYVSQANIYYSLRRYYDPVLQRWTSADPAGASGGINLHQALGNDPANYVDAYGLSLGNYLNWVGKGLYDYMMGDNPGGGDPNSYGAQRAALIGGIDAHDNALRDAMGVGTEMLGNQLIGLAAGEVAGPVLGAGVGKVCSMLGDAFPAIFDAEGAALGEGTSLADGAELEADADTGIASKVITAPGAQGSFTASEFGDAIANNPIASRAYGILQEQGVGVSLYSSADNLAGSAGNGFVNINLEYNTTVDDALSTLIHEAKHIDLEANTGNLYGLRGAASGEYSARALEFFFQNGRRPNALERQAIQQVINSLGY